MISKKYPHYTKLYNSLNKYQIEIYKKLTHNSSVSRMLDFNTKLHILKLSEKVVVLKYKKHVVKLLFRDVNITKSELYFTHLLLGNDVYSRTIQEGSMIILPYYGQCLRNFTHKLSFKELDILKRDCAMQIFQIHFDYIVHHDIKPSNIVKLDSNHDSINNYSWKIIDFGISQRHIPGMDTEELPFFIGTPAYNIPHFTFSDTIIQNEKLFWIYMKDWYGFAKTMCLCGDHDSLHLQDFIENVNRPSTIHFLQNMLNNYNIVNCPYYLSASHNRDDDSNLKVEI